MSNLKKPNFPERNILNHLILLLLKLEVFLIPIFFLPFTFEMYEFNKQNLLWLFTFLAVVLWLINSILIKKEIVYKRTPLDIPIVIFVALWGISAIFSVDVFSSWFGYYGRFSDAYLSTLSFAFLYFLIIHTVAKEQISSFFNIFLYSIIIAFTASLLAISGLLARIPLLGQFNLMQSRSFHLLGVSSEITAILAAVMLVFITSLYSYNAKSSQKKQSLYVKYYILFFLSLTALLLINFAIAWIVLIIGLGALFSFALYITYINKEGADSKIEINIAPALTFFIISILFLFLFSGEGNFNLSKTFFNTNLPLEVMAPASESQNIVWQSFKNNPLFGSGPGTFAYDFSLFRPASLNTHQLWQLRFDKAPIHILELIATVGILGVVSYLAIVGIFFFISFVFLKNMFRTSDEESYLAFAFTFATLSLFVAQLMYLVNTSLLFLFWLSLSMAMVSWRFTFSKIFVEHKIDLDKYVDFMPISKAIMALIIIIFAFFSWTQFKHYASDIYYNNFRLTGERSMLLQAVKLNPNNLNYHIALAKDHINRVRDLIETLSIPATAGAQSLSSADKELLQENVAKAVKEAEAGSKVADNSVMAWETLAVIYRDIKSIAVGSIEPAINYFARASELEPTNPVLLTELGKLYLLHNQASEAIEVLNKSIEYKPDYYEAYVNLAKTYEIIGQSDKALVLLEEVIQQQPYLELVYEIGRLYYNQKDFSKAILNFKQVLQTQSNHANALYSLGLAYQQQGNNQLALEQFEKVLKLNPENEVVRKLIEGLSSEKEAGEELEKQ